MTEQELLCRVKIDDADDGLSTILRLKDQFLNYTFADQLKALLKEFCRQRMHRGVRRFVVDLSAVQIMDSCGLSVLIGLRKIVDENQGRLVLCQVSPIIQRLLGITRLDRVFEVYPDEPAAMVAVARPKPASAMVTQPIAPAPAAPTA